MTSNLERPDWVDTDRNPTTRTMRRSGHDGGAYVEFLLDDIDINQWRKFRVVTLLFRCAVALESAPVSRN